MKLSVCVLAAVFALATSTSAFAQTSTAGFDSRWNPYLGCWTISQEQIGNQPVALAPGTMVCVRPEGRSGIAVTTTVDGKNVLEQTIIADGCRRLQRSLHVSRLDRIPSLVGMVSPDSSQTICLQLDHDLNPVCFSPTAGCALCRLGLRQNTQEILHVMSYLVRNHIGFGEFARLAVAPAKSDADVPEE